MTAETDIALDTDRLRGLRDGHLGWLVYDNPERHNALSLEMQRAVPTVLDAFGRDPEIRVVVARGAGDKAFVSGADISEFETQRSSPDSRAGFDAVFAEAARAYARCEKPIVAMIRGYCLGGGLATALQADLRIASSDAQFGIPAARLGLGYGAEGIETLVGLVGPAFAREILFTARRFSAEEALKMGLVNRIVPPDDLEAETRALAETLADNAPLTLRAAKFAIRQTQLPPDRRDLDEARRLVEECFLSDDYKEGRRAFLEKRRPRFQGR